MPRGPICRARLGQTGLLKGGLQRVGWDAGRGAQVEQESRGAWGVHGEEQGRRRKGQSILKSS